MKIHDCIQDSPGWHELRAQHYTASEAPAMMGASKYQKRTELLKAKATGIPPEVDAETLARFDRGHAAEAAARPIAEKIIEQDLFPATVTEEVEGLPLLASLDGMTMAGNVLFEHKLYSEDLAAQIRAGKVEPHYTMQMEQQLMVTGADKVLFMCSDGTEGRCEWMWYTRVRGRGKKIVAGWKQFEKDLAEYQPVEATVVPEGRAPEMLPALRIEITGAVTASNLDEFEQTAMSVIESVNTDLQTDEDFADAEKAIKWCKDIESRIDAAKQHALSQTASIDKLFRTLDAIKEKVRTNKRLELERLVKRRKEAIRTDIQLEAIDKLHAHYEQINTTLERITFGRIILGGPADLIKFRSVVAADMKGKKTVASLRDAADTALAQAKIDASEQAELTRINLQVLDEHKDYVSLFPDFRLLATTKAADDFKAIVTSRIAEHKATEEKRLEEERARIREEEQRKIREMEAEEERINAGRVHDLQEDLNKAKEQQEAPIAVGVDPAAQPAPQAVSPMTKHPTGRPSSAEIIGVLCDHFNVSASTVVGWLRGMNLEGMS